MGHKPAFAISGKVEIGCRLFCIGCALSDCALDA